MADLIHAFHRGLSVRAPLPLWIIGYSELGPGKIFEPFTVALEDAYAAPGEEELRHSILLFRHFSMNQFSVDLRKRALDGETLEKTLSRVGEAYRLRIFGW
jgi:hypothetical protein